MKHNSLSIDVTEPRYSLEFTKSHTDRRVSYGIAELAEMYLDYYNNFISIERFAKHYGFTSSEAGLVLERGYLCNELLATKGEVG